MSMQYFLVTVPSAEEGVHQLVGMAVAAWLQMGEELLAAVPRAAKDLQGSEKMVFCLPDCVSYVRAWSLESNGKKRNSAFDQEFGYVVLVPVLVYQADPKIEEWGRDPRELY